MTDDGAAAGVPVPAGPSGPFAVGDRVQLISPRGAQTAFGTTPRIESYDVVYIFSAGRYDIDKTRVYMPMPQAQSYFNREGAVDEIQVYAADPERVDALTPALMEALPAS